MQRHLARWGTEWRKCTAHNHDKHAENEVGWLRIALRKITDRNGHGVTQELLSDLELSRNSTARGGGMSPFDRVMGFNPPSSGIGHPPSRKLVSFQELTDQYMDRQTLVAGAYDKHRLEHQVKVGSVVMIPAERFLGPENSFADSVGAKGRAIFSGPFTVSRMLENNNAQVELGEDLGSVVVHVSHIKVMPDDAIKVPLQHGQPEQLHWPGGARKASIAVDKRKHRGTWQYLLHYWGCHDVHAKWVDGDKVIPAEKHLIKEFDRRRQNGWPSMVPPLQVDLETPPE